MCKPFVQVKSTIIIGNAQWQIPVPYNSKLDMYNLSTHLPATQQKPHKKHTKKQFLRILENFHGKGQEKGWLISLQITLED